MAPFLLSDNFECYLVSEKRFSEHTRTAYMQDLMQFFEFIQVDSCKDLESISSKLIRGWIVELVDKSYSNLSINRKLSTLRTYFKWLQREGVLDVNPMKAVQGPKVEKRLLNFVKKEDVNHSNLSELFLDDFSGVRDRLVFEFLYQTGIRSSELIGLKRNDVSNGSIKVLGKRSKERVIPIGKELSRLVGEYLKLREDIALCDDSFFVLNNGKKLYPKFVYRKINEYLEKATELKKRSPHVLRHTFATHMLNNGAGLEVLKELLGHANLSATQIYTHNSFSQLTSIYSQSHPRGHKK